MIKRGEAMIRRGDVVQVKSGPMYGHYADRVGEVITTGAEPLPIRVKFHDRAGGKLMIDSREGTAGFTERDLVLLESREDLRHE
jgi:hypothetical protein